MYLVEETEMPEEEVFDHEDYQENEWNGLTTTHLKTHPSQHGGAKRVKVNKKTDRDVWLPIGECLLL